MSATETIGYRAGEPVRETGLYRVYHSEHAQPRTMFLKNDESFPHCGECGEQVKYVLLARGELPHQLWQQYWPAAI